MVSSRAYPDLERAPGKKDNWVEANGGLPDYIERVAKHIHYEGGHPISTAIAMAISQVKKWAAEGKAQAVKAIAQWEAIKAKAGAKRAVKLTALRINSECIELGAKRGPYERHVTHTKQYGRAHGDITKKASWSHEYQPKTDIAMALKAKHLSKKDLSSTGHPKDAKDQKQLGLPVPPHLQKSKTDEARGAGDVRHPTGAPGAKTTNSASKAPKSISSSAALRSTRNRLAAKVKAGTATAAEKKELNRVITQLKAASAAKG